MIKEYKITKELCSYVETLHYEVRRYNDLLNTINRETHSYTDEEWESSYKYFSRLY